MRFLLSLSFVMLALSFVYAELASPEDIVLKSCQGLRLLSLAEGADPIWKTEDDRLELMRSGIKFVSLHPRR
jgi:bacterial leucyl aminopeptidase